jgi:hypothetical protein
MVGNEHPKLLRGGDLSCAGESYKQIVGGVTRDFITAQTSDRFGPAISIDRLEHDTFTSRQGAYEQRRHGRAPTLGPTYTLGVCAQSNGVSERRLNARISDVFVHFDIIRF